MRHSQEQIRAFLGGSAEGSEVPSVSVEIAASTTKQSDQSESSEKASDAIQQQEAEVMSSDQGERIFGQFEVDSILFFRYVLFLVVVSLFSLGISKTIPKFCFLVASARPSVL